MARVCCFLFISIILTGLCSVKSDHIAFGLNFSRIIESIKVGGIAIGVVHNQSYVETKGFGFQDLLGSEVTENTAFFIGSITKSFTATLAVAISKLKDIKMDDKVDTYYGLNIATPEQENTNMIDLMAHRVGAGSYQFFWLTRGTEEGRNVLENPLTNKIQVVHQGFRSTFIFSSLMYWVLGEALEAIMSNKTTIDLTDEEANRTWCDLVTEIVINELQMNETTCEWRDSGRDGIGGLMAAQLMWNGSALVPIPPGIADQWQNVLAASGMISTAKNMVNWLRFNLKLKIPFEYGNYMNETLEHTHKMHMGIEDPYGMKLSEFGISFYTYGYGLGWYVANYRGFRVLYHDGRLLGHQNLAWMIPEIEFGVYLGATGGTNYTIQHLMLLAMYLTDQFSGNLTEPWLNEDTLVNWRNLYPEELYYPPTEPHELEPLSTCNCDVNNTEGRVRYCNMEYLYFELDDTYNEGDIQPDNYSNPVYGNMEIDKCSKFIENYVPSKPSTQYCMNINKFIGEIQPTNLTDRFHLKPHGQFVYIQNTVYQRPLLVEIRVEKKGNVFVERVNIGVCGLTLDPRVPPYFILTLNKPSDAIALVVILLPLFVVGILLNSQKTIRKKFNKYFILRLPYHLSYDHGIKIVKKEKVSLLHQDQGNLSEHQKLVADICRPKPKKEDSIDKKEGNNIFKGIKGSGKKGVSHVRFSDEMETQMEEVFSAVVQTSDTTNLITESVEPEGNV